MTGPLLLGGSGFIGSALARRFVSQGAAFRIGDVRPSPVQPEAWVRTDVRDADAVEGACASATMIFLLAAEHGLEPRPDQQFEAVNVDGARAVVAAAERAGVRKIVFTSSVAVYGLGGRAADEGAPCRPTGAYGRTKLVAEGILREWQGRDAARTLTIVRPTLVFGTGVRGHMRALLHRLAHPEFVMIGEGTNRKSLACVENLAAFLSHVSASGPGVRLYNYADGPDLSIAEMAALVRGAVGLGPARRRSRRAALLRAAFGITRDDVMPMTVAQVRRFCADSRFVSTRTPATGFQPPVALREALSRYARTDLRWLAPVSPALETRVPAA